jgi:predicted amidohydrolase YtcJ
MADEAAGFGITTVQVFPGTSIERFVRWLDAAQLPIRVRAMALALTTPQGRDLNEIRELSKIRATDPNVTVSGIKWILDGTPFERGAALRRPYNDRAEWRGRLNFPRDEVTAMFDEALELDQPLLLHAVGDQAVEDVFGAMEGYRAKVDWPQERVRLEHGDGVIADLIPRAKKLGVIVVQNPSHFVDAELFRRRWGPDMMRLQSLLAAGIPLALGSDGPMNPFLNILFATTHPYAPTQAIMREQAVGAYTHGSAFAEFAEDRKGTLAVGKLADLVVLSQDVLTVPPPELPKTRSVLTIVGGRVVFDAKVLPP